MESHLCDVVSCIGIFSNKNYVFYMYIHCDLVLARDYMYIFLRNSPPETWVWCCIFQECRRFDLGRIIYNLNSRTMYMYCEDSFEIPNGKCQY